MARDIRKLLTADKIVLTKQPESTGTFPQWWLNMLEQVSQAHVDSDGAYKWAQQCQLRPLPDEEIDNPSKFYAHLDAKWSAALNLVVKGTVASNIAVVQQRMDAAGKRITGRRKAVIVWDYFQTSAAHGGLYSFQNLMAVQLHSHNLVYFRLSG